MWIHGGGNTIGHGAYYDAATLAGRQDVVVVTVNYRLGPFGWFHHPALASGEADAADRSGNYGTLDLVRALEWVRDEIAAFGGDPRRVTVFGESAGGRNVLSLLVVPAAEGLFQRAISQSGGTRTVSPAEAMRTDEPGRQNGSQQVAARLLGEDADGDPEAVAERLRALSAEQVLGAYGQGGGLGMFRMPQLVRDGHVLPVDPIPDLLAAGRHHGVPVMLGTNRDETKLFMAMDPKYTWRLFWILPRPRDPDLYDATAEYGSRAWKLRGADEPARLLRISGHQEVYVYRFDWDEEPSMLGTDLARLIGAGHGVEIPFVFGRFDSDALAMAFDESNRPGRLELSEAMMSYWAEFAEDGRPDRGRDGRLPRWPSWDARAEGVEAFLVLDTAADGGIRPSGDVESRSELLDDLASDARLADAERCEVFGMLVGPSGFEATDREAAGCPDWAPGDVAER